LGQSQHRFFYDGSCTLKMVASKDELQELLRSVSLEEPSWATAAKVRWLTSSRAHAQGANHLRRCAKKKCGLDPAAELAMKLWPFSLGRYTRSKLRTTKSIRPIAVTLLCCLLYSSSGSTSKKATTRTRMSPGRSCRRRRFGRRSGCSGCHRRRS
jgi:hypothetical protein